MPTFLVLLVSVILACLGDLQASLVWRPGEGWVDETSGQGLSASSARDQLELAKKVESEGDIDGALKANRDLVRRWPYSFSAPEAQFKIGFLLEKKAQFWDAYKAYLKMIDKYPNSTFFEQALERMYSIGNLYLAGEPQKIWKLPVGPSMDRTCDIYESIIKAAPFGEYAAQAQFHIGLAKEKDKKYSEAVAAYNKILDKYPNNPIADSAQYQIGYVWMRASSEADYDQSAADKAIEAFKDFIDRYPNSPKVAAARDHIDRLRLKQNQGSFNVAQFYEKQKNYKAAVIYYYEVIREDPDSKNAAVAKIKVEQLSPLADKSDAKSSPEAKPAEPPAAPPVAASPSIPPTNVTSANNPTAAPPAQN